MSRFDSGHQVLLNFLVAQRVAQFAGLDQLEVEEVVHDEDRQEEDSQRDVCSCHGDDAVTRRDTVSRQGVPHATMDQCARMRDE